MTDILLLLVGSALIGFGAFFLSEDRLDPFALFSFLYFPRFILRPGFILLDLDDPAHPFLFVDDPKDLAREAVAMFIVGYVAFAIGYLGSRGRFARALGRSLPRAYSPGMSARRLRMAVVVGLVLSSIVVLSLIRSLGSAADFMYESRHGLWSGFTFLQRMPLVTSFVASLYVFHCLLRRSGLPAALGLLVLCVMIMFTMGDRGGIIYSLFVLVVTYHFSQRRIPFRWFALAALSLASLLLVLGTLRDAAFASRDVDVWTAMEQAQWGPGQSWARLITEYMNLSSIDHLLVVIQDFNTSNFHYGSDFLVGLKGVVPRSLWPDKPEAINLGIWFRDTYLPGKSGKPITAIGGWFINFGYLGVILGLMLSGFVCRVLWEYMRCASFRPWTVLFYVAVFFNVTSWGVITTTMPMAIILWVVPLLVLFWWFVTPARFISRSVVPRSRSRAVRRPLAPSRAG